MEELSHIGNVLAVIVVFVGLCLSTLQIHH